MSYAGNQQKLAITTIMGRIRESICSWPLRIRGGLLGIRIGWLGGVRIRIIREVRTDSSVYKSALILHSGPATYKDHYKQSA
jgi:hypothetical protein